MTERRLLPLLAAVLVPAALAFAVPAARAQVPPALVNPEYGFAFPSEFASPVNAASAGVALADRWLGISGFENPAALVPKGLEISPVWQRVNRQDIAAQNRDYDQVIGYPEFAGARLSMPVADWGLMAYAWRPVLRMEEFSYSTGPLALPAFRRQLTSQRELRAGVAVSKGISRARIGVSGEYVNRDDRYETSEVSGDPTAGDRVIEMSGDGFGGTLGVSWEKDTDRPWGSWFGAAVRYGSEVLLDGTQVEPASVVPGDTTATFSLARSAEWSGGVSGKVTLAPATRFVAGLSFRQGIDYGANQPATGSGYGWSAGIDWKDDELPWGARFGVGQEGLADAVESKAGLLSLGFTWISGDLAIDASILHRNMSREDFPHSSDDRAVLTVKLDF
jgi:hypothetical protein